MATVALVGGVGAVRCGGEQRGRESQGRGKSSRGREEGLDGSGRLRGVFRGVGAQAGSLEVARRASGTQLLRCEGRKTTGGGSSGGLGRAAGPGGLPGERQVRFLSLSLFFLFLFCFIYLILLPLFLNKTNSRQ